MVTLPGREQPQMLRAIVVVLVMETSYRAVSGVVGYYAAPTGIGSWTGRDRPH